MTYSTEILVEIPLNDFIKKLNQAENMKHWQRGLVGYDYISGTPRELGAKMKLTYKLGKRDMELIETITSKKLPNELHMMYDIKGMQNIQENYFEETSEGFTKWVCKNNFIPSSFPLRMMTLLMPGTFKKQTKQYMQDFKNFAEKGTSVRDAKT
ncbi:SRPBCC family protein [Xanthomarina sp. F2636L]|uniref:SRPBCC family protein n=1 Tax=Xanthomarina sp. F2636L TaxID=2996018 RepID=UPI00225DD91B|nr:SRPBCC family protein [Xanthomarina sp. F2636L]MCX7550648.1 SRPBCC family protein [Xanthomarina sp. F2636L]